MSVLASYPTLVLHLHAGPVPVLETEWLGFTGSADFRRYITDALELARQHGVRGWLANDLLLGAVRPADLQWVSQFVLPTMVALGIERFARLEAADTLNRLLIGRMYQAATPELPLEVHTFADALLARKWAAGAYQPR